MTSESTIVANLIRSNNGLLGYDHFSPEGWATVEGLIARGKVERRDGLLFAVATKAGKLTATTTEDAPVVTMDTPVSRELEMVHLDDPPAGGRFAGTRPPEGWQ